MKFDTEKILSETGLFWQYPVITEKTFYLNNKNNESLLALPWATIIDKKVNLQNLFNFLIKYLERGRIYFTCCQHIGFRNLIPLWKALNILCVYSSHKCLNEDFIDFIEIKSSPLYAYSIEATEQTNLGIERTLLYSFIGGYQDNYLTKTRLEIFKMKHPENTLIINTGDWHFNEVVYTNFQNNHGDMNTSDSRKENSKKFNEILYKSRYSLSPSGSGPNSIRFWEALGAGSIPILLSDTYELPLHNLWDNSIVRIQEKDIEKIPEILNKISIEQENIMRKNCIELYSYFKKFPIDPFVPIIHYNCGSYVYSTRGAERFDYLVHCAFPNRIHTNNKETLSILLEVNKNCLVITDNHYACDIPNNIKTILVHHGVARTHAERDPVWEENVRDVCCFGQDRMLFYRNPLTTKIISVSQFCTDEMKKHYGIENYNRFSYKKILTASELDEKLFKKSWNDIPIVLGNWNNYNKGSSTISKFSGNPEFVFKLLRITKSEDYEKFNKEKQEIYLNSDIFLQLSLSEGNSFATLDAMLCGLPIVSTDVGLFYNDVPEDDCFVKIDWRRANEQEYVLEKLNFAWQNKDVLSKKIREWYLNNCSFEKWLKLFKTEVSEFINKRNIFDISQEKLIVRIDDFPTGIRPILDDLTPLYAILDEFEKRKIYFILGIVPSLLNEEMIENLKKYNYLVPACHGYNHMYDKLSRKLKENNDLYNDWCCHSQFNEFEGISTEEIKIKLMDCKKILSKIKSIDEFIYIPPCNLIDTNTKEILEELNFKILINSDYYGRINELPDNINNKKIFTFHVTWEYDDIFRKKIISFDQWKNKLDRLKELQQI